MDYLLFLLLGCNAGVDDLGEAMWIMKHHRPLDHNCIMSGGEISSCGIKTVRKAILEQRGCRFNTSNVFEARRLVLAVFGRIHNETMLKQAIQRNKTALKTQALDDLLIYEVMATASIKEQQKCISRLSQKRSLIGCYPIHLPGDDNEDVEEGEANDEYIVDCDEEEKEEYGHYSSLEKVYVEAPIIDNRESNSELDSDAEIEDEFETEPNEGSHDDEDEPKLKEEEYAFMQFHWNFGTSLPPHYTLFISTPPLFFISHLNFLQVLILQMR